MQIVEWHGRWCIAVSAPIGTRASKFSRISGRKLLAAKMQGRCGMHPKTVALQDRTRRFAADVIGFCAGLPQNIAGQRIAPPLIDSSGSTDSNYRAACRARTKAEFIAKLGVAIEEADAAPLIQEADELLSIFIRSRKTAESRKKEQDRLDKESLQRRSR